MKNFSHYIVNKIYSTPHLLVLELYCNKIKQEICIGRGKRYCVAGELHSKYARKLKIKDSLVDYLKKYVERARVEKIEIIQDKVLIFELRKTNLLAFFYEGHELKFKVFDSEELLKSFINNYNFDSVQKIEWEDYKNYDQELESAFQKKIKNETKSKSKKEQKIKQDILAIEDTLNFSQLLKNDSIQFEDSIQLPLKKIKFEKNMSHWQKRDRVFAFIKKLKQVKEIQENRLLEIQKSVSTNHEHAFLASQEFKTKEKIRVHWKLESKANSHWDKWKYKEYIFYVGKSAKGNNELIDRFFTSEDCWGHPDEVAGPHLIIKELMPDDLSQEFLDVLGSLIEERYKCSFKDFIFCRKSDLRRVSGKLGQVQLRESVKRTYKFKPEWGNKLSLVEA
ncbi:MAG: hypothetical protein COW00_06290 [Bdellovibrio sp. CG12_big_fil_rev_8_21_14_0_65_39_13]|nr:MAG: hypothetical protein COW78_18825 [Bdellovibrio sp. CG22_combo_CG10-13_8_21_14_all_39_27]PIQ60832.1 MAG: hypothetical protein COW00_06290 [Bdellovibrio sp. CG12_big_fil_rev_8_21_14_0_65_39_13]PIR36456.1 MAG: hypothetical protein COV37_03630 [Bdellovibrio sp. CG11_big_fil_rev_8_21_14_0_20_39_38]PJB54130.1 MAG: hypothetical protein CO099_03315 [Bdellovibrio sp. CG_4_9_14_3_um_filter_39_7]